jgi:hypothetical protein
LSSLQTEFFSNLLGKYSPTMSGIAAGRMKPVGWVKERGAEPTTVRRSCRQRFSSKNCGPAIWLIDFLDTLATAYGLWQIEIFAYRRDN